MTDNELKGRNAYIYIITLTMFGKSLEEARMVAIDRHGLNSDQEIILDEYIAGDRTIERG